ncbi:MAG: hypothetical protein ACYC0B_00150 [Gemmatimonadaceae bacterium]
MDESHAPEQEVRELTGFEEAFIDFVFDRGHLAKSMRAEWEERLRARRLLAPQRALGAHRTAAVDYLRMSLLWSRAEVRSADRFLAARGVKTISELREKFLPQPWMDQSDSTEG